ncbi:MAG: methyltransferase domain-containing protein [Alphaproteobacteria bacterium]|nr:methyltransferase domain-containing protein [Alphaproteobacteria bacterium]
MSVGQRRDFYATLVTAKAGTRDEAIRSSFASIDRARFLGPGPWKVFTSLGYIETPSDDPAFIYQDVAVALAPERTINNGEPSLHARCIAALAPKAGESVLHVGAGTGYYTAILANLVGPRGSVAGYEIEADLAERARENLADVPQVSIRQRSAIDPDLPPSDIIYANAGATHPPAEWLAALKPAGRLLFPLSGSQGAGVMLLVTRGQDAGYAARIVMGAAFVPCIGATDDAEAKAVTAALMRGGHGAVRSLVRNDEPDASAWVSGSGWWLSTAPP